MAELHPELAKAKAQTARQFLASFNGEDFGILREDTPGPHDGRHLAIALDYMEELSAMVLNLADRVTPTYGPDNPPRLRKQGESIEEYRAAMGWNNVLIAEQNKLAAERQEWALKLQSSLNEHRNAAMEADLRTQAAVRSEKQALAENETLKLANETNNRLLDERTAQLNRLDATAAHWLQKAHEYQTENTALRALLETPNSNSPTPTVG